MPATHIGSRWNRPGFEGSLDFFRSDTGTSLFTLTKGGVVALSPNPTGAADYVVDGNVSSTGDGSLAAPYLTLKEAITASNTSIGLTANRWWAKRNRIFVMGDQEIDEDLTVLPEKCDVIGIGTDLVPYPRVTGHHIIAAAAVGFRSINMGWNCDATTDLFVLPAGCHGTQFIGGAMVPNVAGSTKALEITSSAHVLIHGVEMVTNAGNHTAGIFAQGISMEGAAGSHQTRIEACFIRATEGIAIASTCLAANTLIVGNYIHATAETINDESSLAHVINNRLLSDASVALAAGAGGITCNELLASGNKLGGKDTVTNADYPFVIQLTS